jgi:ABC-2 type transport system permease protein
LHAIRLYKAFLKVSFLSQLEYRAAYATRMVGKVLSFGSGFALIAILLSRFNAIGSWSTYEVLFLYSLNIFSYSVGATFTMPVHDIAPRIRAGQIDSILTKPVNPMLYYMCHNISAGYTSNYVLGLGVMLLCLFRLDIQVTFFKALYLLLSVLGGALIHGAALIACGVPAFWLVQSKALSRVLYEEIVDFVEYPLSIYTRSIQAILTFVLPYAFINFYPAQMFLSKGDTLFSPVLQYLTPAVGVLCFGLAYLFWNKGLNAYGSAGT